MDRNIKKILIIVTVLLTVAVIGGYSYLTSRNFLNGPVISVYEPTNGTALTDSLVIIKGKASNISFISLDDGQIFIDKYGNFAEMFLLSDGYNIIKLSAKDRFGRTVEKKIELVYKESAPATNATTTVVSVR